MMKKPLLSILVANAFSLPVYAFEPFTVKDIRVEGIQRTEAGTVFSYLPVKVGDVLNDEKSAQSIKTLFATGFFKDVRIEVDRDVMVVVVQERPAIAQINFVGLKEFENDMIIKALKETDAEIGIAFDGDGDRIVMADENGRMLDGNAILAVLGADLLERDKLPDKTLVTTIMANTGLERALKPFGGRVLRTKVGDRYVIEPMREHGYMLGGESSGHIVMLEYNTTGDAMIAALHVLATMIRRDQPLSVLANAYQPVPEAHAKVPVNGVWPSENALEDVRREGESEINGVGCVVIRPSGTEPVIRVMVQHESIRKAEALAKHLAGRIAGLR